MSGRAVLPGFCSFALPLFNVFVYGDRWNFYFNTGLYFSEKSDHSCDFLLTVFSWVALSLADPCNLLSDLVLYGLWQFDFIRAWDRTEPQKHHCICLCQCRSTSYLLHRCQIDRKSGTDLKAAAAKSSTGITDCPVWKASGKNWGCPPCKTWSASSSVCYAGLSGEKRLWILSFLSGTVL